MSEGPRREKRLLREPKVLARVPYSATQLHDLVRVGKFPRPVKLSEGGRAKAWLEEEVDAYIEGLIARRDAGMASG
jgi:prophage regulatory protein